MDLKQFVSEVTDSTFNEAADELTRILRERALSRAWPIGVIRHLRVKYVPDEDKFDITYSKGYKKRIEDLEFGTQNTPPSPVIRTFINSLGNLFTSNFEDSYQQELLDNVDWRD